MYRVRHSKYSFLRALVCFCNIVGLFWHYSRSLFLRALVCFCNLWLLTNTKGFATHSLTHAHTNTLTQSADAKGFDAHTNTHSLSHTHKYTRLWRTLTNSLSLSLTHKYTRQRLWRTHTLTHTYTHSLSLTHTQSANAKGFDACVTFSTDVSSLWGPMTPLAGMCSYWCSYWCLCVHIGVPIDVCLFILNRPAWSHGPPCRYEINPKP